MNWKPIKGYEGVYEVSDTGLVRSLDRVVTSPKSKTWWHLYEGRLMALGEDKDGYKTVGLCKRNRKKLLRVHRLVLQTFKSDGGKKQVNHKDGDKANNNIENLEWATCSQNQKHAHSIGLKNQSGENNNASKLSFRDVQEIRERAKNGERQREIAKDYDVCQATVSLVFQGKLWNK